VTPAVDLDICGTCLCWVANGDDSSLDLLDFDDAEKIRDARDTALLALGGHIVPGDPISDFTWAACDLCGATGRDSNSATLLIPPGRDAG